MASPLRLIYTTFDDRNDALELAQQMVEKRLIACGNLLPPITSIFEWEGTVQREDEYALLCKTTADKIKQATQFLEEHHPYDTPAILTIPIEHCAEAFGLWVAEQTRA